MGVYIDAQRVQLQRARFSDDIFPLIPSRRFNTFGSSAVSSIGKSNRV